MKGIELPINILVVVAVAVIVLLGVIALYFGGFLGPAGTMTQESAKESACTYVMNKVGGCMTANTSAIIFGAAGGPPAYDADGDGTIESTDTAGADTLQALCDTYFGAAGSQATCRRVCGCSG